MIVNPGSLHFDNTAPDYGVPLITYADYPNGATTVSSLSNDPSAVVEAD